MKKISKIIAATTLNFLFSLNAFAATCAKGEFKSVFTDNCIASYDQWILEIWNWAMAIIIPLSVLILTVAGVIYMTSEGDSGRIGTAKKMIIGVASGVGLLILGRLLLVVVLGNAGATEWWQF